MPKHADTVLIQPGRITGSIAAPPSKSVMQRVLAVLLLRRAACLIHNTGDSADDRILKELLRGAAFRMEELPDNLLRVTPPDSGQKLLESVHFGESGLAVRMLLPILSLRPERILLAAAPGLTRRLQGLSQLLQDLGVQASENLDGHLPQWIQGPLQPRDISIDASNSSQTLTGLLLAYAASGTTATITVSKLSSKPYIDLTLQIMDALGLPVPARQGYEQFAFSGKLPRPVPASFTVEGDWSAAAFWLVAGAVSGGITVTGLDAFTEQADKQVLQALMDTGCGLSVESTQVTVRPAPLKPFHFDATDCPDLFPPLAVLACFADGTSVIEGIGRLRHKESDRAFSIVEVLGKMGVTIILQDDLMIIAGGQRMTAATVDAHNDHRIAMMAAIAALRADGDTTISGAASVQKSYPRFFNDLQALGGRVVFRD